MVRAHSSQSWSVLIFRVLDHGRQQRILRAFQVHPEGAVALGTTRESDHFVVVGCDSRRSQKRAHDLVVSIDHRAIRTYTFHRRPDLATAAVTPP